MLVLKRWSIQPSQVMHVVVACKGIICVKNNPIKILNKWVDRREFVDIYIEAMQPSSVMTEQRRRYIGTTDDTLSSG